MINESPWSFANRDMPSNFPEDEFAAPPRRPGMTAEKARLGLTAVIAVAVVAIAGMVYSQMPGEPTFDEKIGAINKTLDEARYWGRLAGTND